MVLDELVLGEVVHDQVVLDEMAFSWYCCNERLVVASGSRMIDQV